MVIVGEIMMDLLSILMAPADTWNYFLMGYAVFFGVMGLYVLSYFVRFRNLNRELALLETLEEDSKPQQL
jgi:hypothetical protein